MGIASFPFLGRTRDTEKKRKGIFRFIRLVRWSHHYSTPDSITHMVRPSVTTSSTPSPPPSSSSSSLCSAGRKEESVVAMSLTPCGGRYGRQCGFTGNSLSPIVGHHRFSGNNIAHQTICHQLYARHARPPPPITSNYPSGYPPGSALNARKGFGSVNLVWRKKKAHAIIQFDASPGKIARPFFSLNALAER